MYIRVVCANAMKTEWLTNSISTTRVRVPRVVNVAPEEITRLQFELLNLQSRYFLRYFHVYIYKHFIRNTLHQINIIQVQ